MNERTLILIKPDAVRRKLIGEIISRIERKGYTISHMKMLTMDEEMATRHYEEHIGKDFFPALKEFITSGPLAALVVEGECAISEMRKLAGKTNPLEADPGTIRGDMGILTRHNLIHAADSPQNARRELDIFFPNLE